MSELEYLDRVAFSEHSWLDVFMLPDSIRDQLDFEELWSYHPEEHGTVRLMGREVDIPRWQQSYLRDYRFSGITSRGIDLPDLLRPLLDFMNQSDYARRHQFNEVLCNWYQNGHHYIGSHADDEGQLHRRSPIVTVSLGATRKFRIRNFHTKEIVEDFDLPDGSVAVMGGRFQREFKHEIVKVNGKKGERVGPRVSITLRQFR